MAGTSPIARFLRAPSCLRSARHETDQHYRISTVGSAGGGERCDEGGGGMATQERLSRTIHLCFRASHIALNINPNNTDSERLYDLIRAAAGAGPDSAVSLVDKEGKSVQIAPSIPPNTTNNPYSILVYNSNGMLIDEVSMDLLTLENRIAELEKHLEANNAELPPIVYDLKHDVEQFRHKLETTKHLSWLNCYKELPPASRRLQYRRRSDAKQKVVREQFLQICEQVISEEVRQALRLSSFDCMQWSDEFILYLLRAMFLDLDLPRKFSIDMTKLSNFLFSVYKNYNEVPFHNFRHCFCVAQMMYAMTWKATLVKRIGDLEVLILLVSCICHDLDHPGYNNIYQINARTELALRYNDISPLENHHCSIAFRILELEDCNIFSSLSPEDYKIVREGIIRCILATDMARHNEILGQFREACAQGFDYTNKTHINLLTMVLIKVADISNEARPMEVAEPWLDRLLQEFFTQSDAEKQEGLPVTPFMDREKITKPSSQCSFIGFVLLPLFEALCDLLTELQPMMVEPVRQALEHYRRLNEAHHKNSTIETAPPSPIKHVSKSSSSYSVRKTSISFSQYAEDDEDDVLDGLSTEGEETVTEVAVSEKTLKFKISTESTSSSGRKSYPGSRKGSREKYQQDEMSQGSGECCGRKEALKDRSQSLVEWKRESGPVGGKPRSVSAGSPEGLREFGRVSPRCDDPLLETIGEGPSCTQDESISAESAKKSPNSIVGRLKRLAKGSEAPTIPDSPASLKGPRVSSSEVTVDRRAMTLPKTARRKYAAESKKGWRGLLRRNRLNGLSHDTMGDMEEATVNNNKKSDRGDVSTSPNSQRHHWMHSLVSSLRGKKSKEPTKTGH